ncbi:5'-methylthioadenosine/S-adenosylhomocysteine nucleosidase [Spiroplasma endosymbiont of Labia minor]|uniref:5'-methylthioadenosine/S-adenosylhomocysteine nucleosidase family protein n=1 Tax=Spiroplasma endosymbiont of Labia minor TaxID=3066305 RepID=UPI0030CBF23F
MFIIVAMYDEVKYYLENNNFELIQNEPFKIFKHKNNFVAISGIGLVNATIATTLICENYLNDDQILINIGLAGSIEDNFDILDLVLIENSTFSFANATGFGYEKGQIPKEEKFFANFNNEFVKQKMNKIKFGNLASSDIFISDYNSAKENFLGFPIKIDLLDMEANAIAFTCYKFKKKLISLKIVSDILKVKIDNESQFKNILELGSKKIEMVLTDFENILNY